MCCMPLKPLHTCFRGATTKKNIVRRKMAKKCQFLAQIRVFWVRLVSWSPPYPILRVLDSEKDALRAIEAMEQVFQGRHHQKKYHFSPKNGQKMPFFSPNQYFLGPGGQFVPPFAYFKGAGLKKNVLHANTAI